MSTSGVLLPFNITGKIDPEAELAIRQLWKGVTDAHAAIGALVPKVNAGTGATPATTVTPQTVISGGGGGSTGSTAGSVNQQTGTSYLLQNSDYGALIVVESAVPFALSLNNAVTLPFYCVIESLGVGITTVTPTFGDVNDLPSLDLVLGSSAIVFFDGINWWVTTLPPFPQSLAASVSFWLNSYDATTGLFTTAQPDYSNLTGTPTIPSPTNLNPIVDGVAAPGTAVDYSRADHVHPTDTGRASKASPLFTGVPIYVNNAAAIAGGLAVGSVYRSGADPDLLAIVH